jgi:hypothetical protein
LPGNQTTEKKEEKADYENHTHFKYDSQININLREFDIRLMQLVYFCQ